MSSLAISRLIKAIEEFRKFDASMHSQAIQAFLFIADRNQQGIPVSVKDVGDFLGVSSASASRNVSLLSKISRHRVAGHDLVVSHENPEKRIEKLIELTPKGKRVLASIISLLG